MEAHACNSSTYKAKAEESHKFKASLGYKVGLFLNKPPRAYWTGSVLATTPNILSSVPETHMVEEENWLLHVVSGP